LLKIVIQFCQFLGETYPRKFETKQMHSPPHLVSYLRTDLVKSSNFLRHTIGLQHQIRSLRMIVKLSHQITIK